jgi:hypothetical protein
MAAEAGSPLLDWVERQSLDEARRRRATRAATVLFLGLLAASIALVAWFAPDALAEFLEYAGVALAGGLVGLAELVSRYRDQPLAAATSGPGLLYISINAAASLGALVLIFAFDWEFGASGDAVLPTQLLIASFGAMALFRTSLFTVRAGDQDIGIGPSSLLTIILEACDRGVDRIRAKARAWQVARVMSNVSYEKADKPLSAIAVGLMQNLPDSNQSELGVDLEGLRNATDLSPDAKALLLGLAIADQVGPFVLEAAKLSLGHEIMREPRAETAAFASPEALAEARKLDERLAAVTTGGEAEFHEAPGAKDATTGS